jgi:hypothetical protein
MIHLEWILHPALQLAVLALGLSMCLCLFWSLKLEAGALDARRRKGEAALAEGIAALHAALNEVRAEFRAEVHRLEEQTGMLVAPAPVASGLNLTRRGQALQMYRRGQSPEQIAAALGLPLTEINLLVKVHQIVLARVS